jgi:hypothetical protein
MKKQDEKNTKVFFSINPQIYKNFEIYCDKNFINKSKIIEGLMNILVEKSSIVNDLLKNK